MTNKKTFMNFLEAATKKFGNTYDYSKVVYVHTEFKVEIICPKHGSFWQTPYYHLHSTGCPRCFHENYHLGQENFIQKVSKIHQNKYDYSLVKYKNIKTPVIIICPVHGKFEQTPRAHLKGQGCSKCGRVLCSKKLRYSKEQFIEEAKKIHGNRYDYSQVVYVNNMTKVKIGCPIHGYFLQGPNSHLQGKGCPKCGFLLIKSKRQGTTLDFIAKAQKVHGDKYDYSKVKYKGSYERVAIKCPKHGIFLQLPYNHLFGAGCPKCKRSSGEDAIAKYLNAKNIKYKVQYKFKDCVYKRPLRFDFAIFNNDGSLRCLIEYQGEQHFKSISGWGGKKTFKTVQKRDAVKKNYCLKKNIPLIYIKYNEDPIKKLECSKELNTYVS